MSLCMCTEDLWAYIIINHINIIVRITLIEHKMFLVFCNYSLQYLLSFDGGLLQV